MKKKRIIPILFFSIFISFSINIACFIQSSYLEKEKRKLEIEINELENTTKTKQIELKNQEETLENLKEEKKNETEDLEEWKLRVEKIKEHLS